MALRKVAVKAPVYKGSKFTWGEVLKNSGYPPGMCPFGPFRTFSGKTVATPRRNAVRHARNMDRLRTQVNAARIKHGLKPMGLSPISWARSPRHNHDVGGASDSRHLYMDACDISVQHIRNLMPWNGGTVEFDQICNRIFVKGGFGTYPGGSRHVDSRGYRSRWTTWVPSNL